MQVKNLRSLIALFLAFIITFSPVMTLAANRSDIDGHWAQETINDWISEGLANGYDDGSFHPNDSITRAEFVAFVNRAFSLTAKADFNFPDVLSSSWYANDILIAKEAAYINGYEDGTFRPEELITRQEAAVILANLLNFNGDNSKNLNTFSDKDKISSWSQDAIIGVVEKEVMTGYPDGTFKPAGLITRAEAVVSIDRGLNVNNVTFEESGTYGPEKGIETIEGTVVVDTNDVTLRNMVINGDLILAEGIGEGDVYLKNVVVKGTTYVNGGGENSIHFEDTVLITVIVNKQNGSVRLVAEGSSSIEVVNIESGAILEESSLIGNGFNNVLLSETIPANANVTLAGTFETVDVVATTISVQIPSGSINQLNVAENSSNTNVNLGTDARVETVVLNAIAAITGNGRINNATVNVTGATIEQRPSRITLGESVTATIGGRETTSSSGGTTSGSSGGSVPSVTEEVYIDSIVATDDSIFVTFEDSVNGLSITDFVISATVNDVSYTIEEVSYDATLNKITFSPIQLTLGEEHIRYTVVASNSSTKIAGQASTVVYGFGGRIQDVEHLPVSDVLLKFRKGTGNTTGTVVATANTNANGYYSVALSPGIYTGEIVKEGFITTYLVAVADDDVFNTGENATAIRIPEDGEIRIVLTWDLHPEDLDSHLIGPTPNQERFHTAYYNKQYNYNGELYTDLDLDDTTSYGPETTTIRQQVDGTYRFVVHHFSGQNTLRTSNAKVEVYKGATLLQTYHVPTGEGTEEYWVVFEMNGDTFTTLNELTDDESLALDGFEYGSEGVRDVLVVDNDTNPGIDGRDFTVNWTPAVYDWISYQSIYIIPYSEEFSFDLDSGLYTPVDILDGDTVHSWTGTESIVNDSLGNAFLDGQYLVYVVALSGDGFGSTYSNGHILMVNDQDPNDFTMREVTVVDNDTNPGIDGRDFTVNWTPPVIYDWISTQSIYIIPSIEGNRLDLQSHNPVFTLDGNTDRTWTGTESIGQDSEGNPFVEGRYLVYVVAQNGDGSSFTYNNGSIQIGNDQESVGVRDVTVVDNDLNNGIDGRDFTVNWTLTPNENFVKQEIYIIPGTTDFSFEPNSGLYTPVDTLTGNSDKTWTGDESIRNDSKGNLFTQGLYYVYVMARDEVDGYAYANGHIMMNMDGESVTENVYNLSSLEVTGVTLTGEIPITLYKEDSDSAGFDSYEYWYDATVTNDVYQVKITSGDELSSFIHFHVNDNNKTANGPYSTSEPMDLNVGGNIIRTYGSIDDLENNLHTNTEQYYIYLTREASVTEDVYVEDITISGATDLSFDSDTYFYDVTANQSNISVTASVYGTDSEVISVKANDTTYTVNETIALSPEKTTLVEVIIENAGQLSPIRYLFFVRYGQ